MRPVKYDILRHALQRILDAFKKKKKKGVWKNKKYFAARSAKNMFLLAFLHYVNLKSVSRAFSILTRDGQRAASKDSAPSL